MRKEVKDQVQTSEERQYKAGLMSKIPTWVIILLLKYWAAAAAIFFSTIGSLGIIDMNVISDFNLIIFIGLFLALFTNYLIRPMLRNIYDGRNNVYRYNMINIKGFLSFVLALIYNLIISFILYFVVVFFGSKGWILNPLGNTSFGIEPFSYALFYIVVDFIFLFFKDLIIYIVQRIKYHRQNKIEGV